MFTRLKLGDDKYPALTGVRAAGASIVFFDHFPVVVNAYLTVNVMAFFYALSGFLIFRIYYEPMQLSRGWAKKYFVNRFARIYPVYFLLLTLAVLLSRETQPWVLVKNYTLTHALFHPSDLIIQPSWSLTVEECFYFLAPALMLIIRKRGFLPSLLVGCLLLVVALVVSRLPTNFLHTPGFVLSTTFFGHFLEFFAGVYLALAIMRIERQGLLAIDGHRFTLAGCLAVLLVIVAMIVVYGRSPLHLGLIVPLNNFLIPIPIALLYFGLIRERTWLSELLSSKFAALLGRSSYSFYVLHILIINYLSIPYFLPRMGSRFWCVLLTFILTWVLSILLFVLFEEPLNLFIREKFRPRAPGPILEHG